MNPFISCRLDSRGREGSLPTSPKHCRRLRGRREETWSISSCTLTHKSNIPLMAADKLSPSLSLSVSLSSSSFTDEHDSGACYLKMFTVETSRRYTKQCFGYVTNHKSLGNDAVISHATAQRAGLQPGLLKPDKDSVTYWTVTSTKSRRARIQQKIATSWGKYN